MVKLTLVGRVKDGLPLAEGPTYMNQENDNLSTYKQQGEFILKEISRGALSTSKMTIFLNSYCFNYIVENGVCFMALCDSAYPRRLAFHYLQDLHKEFDKFHVGLTGRITKPYSFIKFNGIIGIVQRKYEDTRTQANLSKLNVARSQEPDNTASEFFSQIVKRRRRYEMLERISNAHLNVSPIWGSKSLEIIALKWIPIGIILAVATLLLWISLIHKDDYL
ncbi:25.3 kDa vesicle transport protein [Olea europaea var. sylvestris]|uniref:KDa vesicle transport n=1 Tax=Olea europaea subsp. europaea TaxID=158383 RepID=A0A8S0U8M2_OLEEU|nr:25.3 kDa vesicle transport protein [Olea europaea var. sylvestris]CAA3012110.1 kDa vesicle transport [Olea europaea subsp. europaea]